MARGGRKALGQSRPKGVRARTYLKEWREHRGLTQQKLAELAEYSVGMISQIESRQAHPSGDSLKRLAVALGCEPGDIVSRPPSQMSRAPILAAWERATPEQRQQLLNMADIIVPPKR